MQQKNCAKCLITKSEIEFYILNSQKGKLSSYCKDCVKLVRQQSRNLNKEVEREKNRQYELNNKEKRQIRKRELYKLNPDKAQRRFKKYRLTHPLKIRELRQKYRHKKANLDFNYLKEDECYTRALFDNKCFICQLDEIEHILKFKESLHIDHLYPLNKGYGLTRYNAILLCKSCNSSKHNKLPLEFFNQNQLEKLNSLGLIL